MNPSGDKKVIKINPDLFKLSNNNTRKNKPEPNREKKPIKMKSVNRDKTIKRDMLRRIRANQAVHYDKLFNPEKKSEPIIVSTEDKFETEFNDTLDFMNKLVDKHKREQEMPKHNQTVRNVVPNVVHPNVVPNVVSVVPSNIVSNAIPNVVPNVLPNVVPNVVPNVMSNVVPNVVPNIVHNVLPNPAITPPSIQSVKTPISNAPISNAPNSNAPNSNAPSYGCLKNGSLPTYRNYINKTVKPHSTGGNNNAGGNNTAIERIRARLNERANRQVNVKIPRGKPNKLIRRTYHVGKDKFRPVVGVLLPNRTIRNNVVNKTFQLKNTPIEDIRKFLLRNGFIKVGSTSPNDVLYKMYESIMLINGEVKNHNPDNLLYNFFNEKGG